MSISWLVASSVLTVLKVHGKLKIHPLPHSPTPHKRISCSVSLSLNPSCRDSPIMSCCCPVYTVKEYPPPPPTHTHTEWPPSPMKEHTSIIWACPRIRNEGIPSCSVLALLSVKEYHPAVYSCPPGLPTVKEHLLYTLQTHPPTVRTCPLSIIKEIPC